MSPILPVMKYLKPRPTVSTSFMTSALWKTDFYSKDSNDDIAKAMVRRERRDSFEVVDKVESPTLGPSNDNAQFNAVAKCLGLLSPKDGEEKKNNNADTKTGTENSKSAIAVPGAKNEDVNADQDTEATSLQFSWEMEPEFDRIMAIRAARAKEAKESDNLRKFYLFEEADDDGDYDGDYEQLLSASSQAWGACDISDGVYRARILSEMQELLAHPNVHPVIRQQFSFMTNMVLRMNYAMFHSHKLVLQSEHFLAGPEKGEIQAMAREINKYARIVDEQMQQYVTAVERMYPLYSEIQQDNDAAPAVLYKRMAKLAAKNLHKPRIVEKHILTHFIKVYESYVFNSFLEISAHHAQQEDKALLDKSEMMSKQKSKAHDDEKGEDGTISPDKMELYQTLIGLWKMLSRAIANYDFYIHSLKDLKQVYLEPVIAKMDKIPVFTKEDLMADDDEDDYSGTESGSGSGYDADVDSKASDNQERAWTPGTGARVKYEFGW